MGTVSTAVGCAVGIPIGVGILISLIFWVRLQRKFKRELDKDQELEHAVYDESGFISFDNVETLKQNHKMADKELSNNDSSSSYIVNPDDNKNNNSRTGSTYIPAYRKKINSMQMRATRINYSNSFSEPANNNIITNQNAVHITNGSMTSLSESSQQNSYLKQHKQTRLPSVYDQMVPIVHETNNEKYFTKPPASHDNLTNSPKTFQSSENSHTSNSLLMNSNDKDNVLLKTLYESSDLDLGSYYPRRPTNPNLTDSSSNINSDLNSSSHMTLPTPTKQNRVFSGTYLLTNDLPANSINYNRNSRNLQNQSNNIFNTPSTERSGFDFQSINDTGSIEQQHNLNDHHLHNRSHSQNNPEFSDIASTTTGNNVHDNRVSDSESNGKPSVYKLQNNYDVENNNEITEEDQYENEFTNYTENRREFINSLRPN